MKSTKKQRSVLFGLLLVTCISATLCFPAAGFGQQQKSEKPGSHSTRGRAGMPPGARELVEEATTVVCSDAKLDPLSSMAIDEMQARPSLPVQAAEARSGATRAQRLLPIAKALVISSLKQLVIDYGLQNARGFDVKVAQGIERVQAVKSVRPGYGVARQRVSISESTTHDHLRHAFFSGSSIR
jgi:hypothetical protein